MSVAEAMLCGTPVIAFNRGSMGELIIPGKTGFLVDTVDQAVEAVSDLGKIDRGECRNWSEEQFSQEKMVDGYVKLYERVVSNRSA
jgi:glycosyltransferase involved in cell wall biosynthesis